MRRAMWPLVLVVVAAAAGSAGDARAHGVVRVPAGEFWMGRDDAAADEAPLHRVFVREFWIERDKITNAEFAAFLNAHGLVSPDGERRYDHDDADARIHRTRRWTVDAGYADHPAVEVTWFGARDFCAARGQRLPTEAEWEKAARGDDRRIYPWGSAPPSPERAVYGRPYNATEGGHGRAAGVSPHHVDNMLGNLREWTSTILRPYPYRDDDGREPFSAAAARAGARVVVRGASHDDPTESLSVTVRHSYDGRGASAGHHHVGFRCVRPGETVPGGR